MGERMAYENVYGKEDLFTTRKGTKDSIEHSCDKVVEKESLLRRLVG